MDESRRNQEQSRKRKRSSSRLPVSRGRRPALCRADAGDRSQSRTREATSRSRTEYREYPPRTSSTTRRRSSSHAPTSSAVHREADEHRSLGRVSQVSAKKGRMSDLLYDTVQENALEQQQEEDEPRTVHRIDDSSDDDDGRRDLDEALDDQALDLCVNFDDYRILDSDS